MRRSPRPSVLRHWPCALELCGAHPLRGVQPSVSSVVSRCRKVIPRHGSGGLFGHQHGPVIGADRGVCPVAVEVGRDGGVRTSASQRGSPSGNR